MAQSNINIHQNCTEQLYVIAYDDFEYGKWVLKNRISANMQDATRIYNEIRAMRDIDRAVALISNKKLLTFYAHDRRDFESRLLNHRYIS